MTALRKQAADMLEAMPEEVIALLIRQMEKYQQEQELRAEKKMDDFLAVCQSAEGQGKIEALRKKYGSLTDALSGILPMMPDDEVARERALRDKYEIVD